jgi:hypothetical protein
LETRASWANNEKRKAKDEKRTTKSEQRKTNNVKCSSETSSDRARVWKRAPVERTTKNEKRTANNEKRKAKDEKRKANWPAQEGKHIADK